MDSIYNILTSPPYTTFPIYNTPSTYIGGWSNNSQYPFNTHGENNSIAIGYAAPMTNDNSIAIGAFAQATALNSSVHDEITIGYSATTNDNSIAIGASNIASRGGSVTLTGGSGGTTAGSGGQVTITGGSAHGIDTNMSSRSSLPSADYFQSYQSTYLKSAIDSVLASIKKASKSNPNTTLSTS